MTDYQSQSRTLDACFVLDAESPRPYSDFEGLVWQLKSFLSLCTGCGVIFNEVYGIPATGREFKIYRPPIQPKLQFERFRLMNALFRPGDGDFDIMSMAGTWFRTYPKLRHAIDSYTTGKYFAGGFLESNFTLLAHSIEPLFRHFYAADERRKIDKQEYNTIKSQLVGSVPQHCRDLFCKALAHGNNLSYREMTLKLLERFDHVFSSQAVRERICDKVVKTRHFHAHPSDDLARKAESGVGLIPICQALEVLHELCLVDILFPGSTRLAPIKRHKDQYERIVARLE